jgi:hypothetical protein
MTSNGLPASVALYEDIREAILAAQISPFVLSALQGVAASDDSGIAKHPDFQLVR